jgi:predicted aspartyl protease
LASAGSCRVEKTAEVPLRYYRGTLAVTAKINNSTIDMGLDTGAQTLVTPDTSGRFDFAPDGYRRVRAIGTAGTAVVDKVLLSNFEFAGKRYKTFSVAEIALPAPSSSKMLVNPLAGLIGSDLLSEYDIDLDLEGKSMTLYKVRGCAKVTPPWPEPYTPVAVKITSRHNIILPVEVEGHRLPALLDTGATHFAISRRGAIKSGVTEAQLRADPKREVSGVGGMNVNQPVHSFQTLVIGGETFRNVAIPLTDARLGDAEVLVGLTYLTPRRAWISYATGMLFIRAPKTLSALQSPQLAEIPAIINAPPAPPPSSTSAVAIPCYQLAPGSCGIAPELFPKLSRPARPLSEFYVQKPKGFIGMETVDLSRAAMRALGLDQEAALLVIAPIADGPADQAGVRAGDIVLAYNGPPVSGRTAFDSMIAFKGEGFAMELFILRQGRRLTITVPLAGPEEERRLQNPSDPSASLERVIAEEQDIIEMFHAPSFRIDRALAEVRLANALRSRSSDDRAGDLNRAIALYRTALGSLQASAQPHEWASAQHGLGVAYHARDGGSRGEDLAQAVQPLEAAYNLRGVRAGTKADFAATALELGLVYTERSDAAPKNAEKAIACFNRAAGYYDARWHPKEYRQLNEALARAQLLRKDRPRAAQLEDAISAYEKVLQTMDKSEAPDEFEEIAKTVSALRAETMHPTEGPGGTH